MQNFKFMCTCGPKLADPATIAKVINEGVDAIRINFSHGTSVDHERFFHLVQEGCKLAGKTVTIMGDITGPKFRIGKFKDTSVTLNNGDIFTFDSDETLGDETRCYLPHPEILIAALPGDVLLLNDGDVKMQVVEALQTKLITKVIKHGVIGNAKGISLPTRELNCEFPSKRDLEQIETAKRLGIKALLISFVQTANDILSVRKIFDGHLMAKVETIHAMKNLESIAEVSDSILIARGDLGVEAGLTRICINQKDICERLRGKITIVAATQFLDSMMKRTEPTRSEANDVYQAVMDGVDGILLTGETANAIDPVNSVQWLKRLVKSV